MHLVLLDTGVVRMEVFVHVCHSSDLSDSPGRCRCRHKRQLIKVQINSQDHRSVMMTTMMTMLAASGSGCLASADSGRAESSNRFSSSAATSSCELTCLMDPLISESDQFVGRWVFGSQSDCVACCWADWADCLFSLAVDAVSSS